MGEGRWGIVVPQALTVDESADQGCMDARACPKCGRVWHSSGWQGPVRVRCECGQALNLAEAQLDRELIDEAKALAEELNAHFSERNKGE